MRTQEFFPVVAVAVHGNRHFLLIFLGLWVLDE